MVEARLPQRRDFMFCQSHAARVFVFALQRRVKHRGIVGGKHDRNSVAEQFRQRMVLDAPIFSLQLLRQCAGADISSRANFERDAAFGEKIHQTFVVDRGDAMADPLDAEQLHRFANFIGAADFAGMN